MKISTFLKITGGTFLIGGGIGYVTQKTTGFEQDIKSADYGGGLSYQFFIGRAFYIQPGIYLYLRGDKSAQFNEVKYNIAVGCSFVLLKNVVKI
jgi:hypothetical protein